MSVLFTMMPPHFNRILVLNLSFRIFWYSKDQYSWLHQSQKGPELAKQLQTNHHNKTMNSFSESVCYASKETHTVQKVFSSVQTYSLKVLGIIEMGFFFCSFWSAASLNLELCHGCHFCPVCSLFLSHEGRPTVLLDFVLGSFEISQVVRRCALGVIFAG